MATQRPLVASSGSLAQIATGDTIDPAYLPAIHSFPEQSSDPATPSAGTLSVYAKTDHKIYSKDSTGTVTQIGAGGSSSTQRTFAYFAS